MDDAFLDAVEVCYQVYFLTDNQKSFFDNIIFRLDKKRDDNKQSIESMQF